MCLWCSKFAFPLIQEVDLGAGPFILIPVRAEAFDYTQAIWNDQATIMSGLGGRKVDPWGFTLPLTPLVWAAILTTLGVLVVLQLFPSCLSCRVLDRGGWPTGNAFKCVRVILQQGQG